MTETRCIVINCGKRDPETGERTPRQRAVIFDMDGTLCNVSSIRHYVRKPNRDFDSFHKASVLCPPNQVVLDALEHERSVGSSILIVTGRKAKYMPVTTDWLAKYGVRYDALFMRDTKDGRKDVDVKRDMLKQLRETWDIAAAYDDNPSIIELWQSEGIDTVVVPGWEVEETK